MIISQKCSQNCSSVTLTFVHLVDKCHLWLDWSLPKPNSFEVKGTQTLCDFTSRIVSKRSLGKGEDTKKHKEKIGIPLRGCVELVAKKKCLWLLSTYFDFIVTFREQPALRTNRRLVTVGFIDRFNPLSSSNTRKITIDWLIDLSHNCARDPEKNRANASVGQKIWREPRICSLFVWRNKRWRPCRLRFSGCSGARLPIFQLRISSMSGQS